MLVFCIDEPFELSPRIQASTSASALSPVNSPDLIFPSFRYETLSSRPSTNPCHLTDLRYLLGVGINLHKSVMNKLRIQMNHEFLTRDKSRGRKHLLVQLKEKNWSSCMLILNYGKDVGH